MNEYNRKRGEVKKRDWYKETARRVPFGRQYLRRIQDAGNRLDAPSSKKTHAPSSQAVIITMLVFIASGSAGWVIAQLAPFGLGGRLITQFLPVWGAFLALARGDVLKLGITGDWLHLIFGVIVGVMAVAIHGGVSPNALLLLPARLVQAGAEEIVFRGWLMGRVPGWRGMMWSVGLFTLMHGINPGFNLGVAISITAFGVFCALWRRQSGNVMGAWGFHAGWNLGL